MEVGYKHFSVQALSDLLPLGEYFRFIKTLWHSVQYPPVINVCVHFMLFDIFQ